MNDHIIIAGNGVIRHKDDRIFFNDNLLDYVKEMKSQSDIILFFDQHHACPSKKYVPKWDWKTQPLIPVVEFIFGPYFEEFLRSSYPQSDILILFENSLRAYAIKKIQTKFVGTKLGRGMFTIGLDDKSDLTYVPNCKAICISMFELLLARYSKITWVLEAVGALTKPYNAIAAAQLFPDQVEMHWFGGVPNVVECDY